MAKILLISDVEDNIRFISSALDRLGHELLEARSIPIASEIASQEDLDLLMLCAGITDTHELEIISLLKRAEATCCLPIILVISKDEKPAETQKQLAAGADEYIARPFNDTELLARINSMLRIKKLSSHMSLTHKVFEEEMVTAQKVQSFLLPSHFPYPESLRFYTRYVATSSIGGDFYDVLDKGDGKVGVVIADVSGHGPSAALIVSTIKTLIYENVKRSSEPERIVKLLNEQLLKILPEDRFVSLFFGMVDLNDYSMSYVRCGHPYPYIMRKHNRSLQRLDASGEFVGLHDDLQVEQEKVTLNPGDRLFTYSDGLVDVCNSDGRTFGFKRLVNMLEQRFDQDGDELLSGLLKETAKFDCAKCAEDDVAILMAEVL